MTKESFIKGTLILIIAGLLTRILGFFNRIILARTIGEEGVGLYMMAVPTFILAVTITQLGLPVAVSKLIAEQKAAGNRQAMKRILLVSLCISLLISLTLWGALVLLSPILSKNLLTDSRTFYPLLAIGPILPVIAASSILRAYFQGLQQMKPSAFSQVIEQVFRIASIIIFTPFFLQYGIEFAALGAVIALFVGEFASFIYILLLFRKKVSFSMAPYTKKRFSYHKKVTKSLLDVALPTTGSRFIGSISYFLEPIVVAQSLAIAGVATAVATRQYGELTGYALPLVSLPTFISYALSVALVPAISEAYILNNHQMIVRRLHQTLRLSFLTGGLAVVVLYTFSEPMTQLMYDAPQVAKYVQLMAPFCLFLYIQGPLQAVLQAMNAAKLAMFNSFFGALIKTILLFLLASTPSLGILGVAFSIAVGMTVVTIFHFISITKLIGYVVPAKEYIIMIVLIVVTHFLSKYVYTHFLHSYTLFLKTMFAIMISIAIYFCLAVIFRLIDWKQLKKFMRLFKSFR